MNYINISTVITMPIVEEHFYNLTFTDLTMYTTVLSLEYILKQTKANGT